MVAHKEVTKEICTDSSNTTICEVYVNKGLIDGKDINTCLDYCSAFRLKCMGAFEDEDECEKDTDKARDCATEFTVDDSTPDLICSCAKIGKYCF